MTRASARAHEAQTHNDEQLKAEGQGVTVNTPQPKEPTDFELLDTAYQHASENAADPRAQSAFREAWFAYRTKFLALTAATKGAQA